PILSPKPPPTSPSHPLSLHDALPISGSSASRSTVSTAPARAATARACRPRSRRCATTPPTRAAISWIHCSPARTPERPRERSCRSEEHTSELQSPDHLVCRLLLEKKK